MNKYIAIDEDCSMSFGQTPEEAIDNYVEVNGYSWVNDLEIYELTKVKAKVKIEVSDGT